MEQCIHCRFGNPEDAKFCRRAAKRSGTLEGFAVDAAADARPGPVLHVAARRGGAGQFQRQARPHWGWILAMIVQMLLTLLAIVLIFAVILGGFAALLGSMP